MTSHLRDIDMKNSKSLAIYSVIVLILYALTLSISAGWVTYLISTPALLVIGLTSLARANDIGEDATEARWDVRRFGLALTGSIALMYLVGPLFNQYPSWRSAILIWGVALTWLTTPGMPPWWQWVTGEWDKEADVLQRFKTFIKSIFGR